MNQDRVLEIINLLNDHSVFETLVPLHALLPMRTELAEAIVALLPQGDGEGLLTKEGVRIWDKELPSFFSNDVIDPEFELETYGFDVAKAQQLLDNSRHQEEIRAMLNKLNACTSYLEMNDVLKELLEE